MQVRRVFSRLSSIDERSLPEPESESRIATVVAVVNPVTASPVDGEVSVNSVWDGGEQGTEWSPDDDDDNERVPVGV